MKKMSFSLSLLFFWLKGTITVDDKFIKTNLSNTVFGFIPAGKDNQNIPVKNISGAMLSSSYNIKAIIIGIILIFVGLGAFGSNIFSGLFWLILGVGIAGSGIKTVLTIEKAGTPYQIFVPFFEKQKMAQVNDFIHIALSEDIDKTDLNLYFDKK